MKIEAGRVRASSTALGDAFIRAFHLEDSPCPVFSDTVADALLTDAERERFTAGAQKSVGRRRPDLAADPRAAVRYWIEEMSVAAPHVLLRARYTEDVLRWQAAQKQAQYVLLGAGLDSFALRRPAWARDIRVFEVDHPATQELKRSRVARLTDAAPGLPRWVPADLGDERLAEVLSGVRELDPTLPTVVAWCGVTYYLEEPAIDAVLGDLREVFTGELTVVLDYWQAEYLDEQRQDAEVRSMFASVRRNDEPFVTGFTPARLAALAASRGYAVAEDLSAVDVVARIPGDDGARVRPHPIGRLARLRRAPA